MPLYEYKCECGNGEDVLLSFQDTQPQICKCGGVMQRKISLSSFVLKQTSGQMALDSLNSKSGGFPDASKHKSWVQREAFEGTQKKDKTVF